MGQDWIGHLVIHEMIDFDKDDKKICSYKNHIYNIKATITWYHHSCEVESFYDGYSRLNQRYHFLRSYENTKKKETASDNKKNNYL